MTHTETYTYKGNTVELFNYETELGSRWSWQFFSGPQGYSSSIDSVPSRELALSQAQGLIDTAIEVIKEAD